MSQRQEVYKVIPSSEDVFITILFVLQFYKDTLSENGDKEKNGESTEDVEMIEDGM